MLGTHFAVRRADAAAVPRSRRDADDLHRPFHGIRSLVLPGTFEDHVDCYRARLRPGQRYGARTALRIWGLPVPWRWTPREPLEVVAASGQNPPRTAGVKGLRLNQQRAETWTVRGLTVIDPVAAVFSVASEISVDEAVILLDALITDADNYPGRMPMPAVSVADIRARMEQWGRFRGVTTIRAALPRVREHVESPKETETRLLLVRSGLAQPVVQHEAVLAGQTMRLDLAYPDLRIAIEYEGDGHRTDRKQWRRDVQRHRLLVDAGWIVIRLTQLDLDDPDDVLERIHRAIARARRG